MTTGGKLVLGGIVIAGVTVTMAYLGATTSWQYYLTAEECLAGGPSLVGARIRVSGKIAPGTLEIGADRRQAAFSLAAPEASLPVICAGPLPDNLADEIDVVVEGRLERPDLLRGHKVLTRCSSKYQSQAASRASEAPSSGAHGGRS